MTNEQRIDNIIKSFHSHSRDNLIPMLQKLQDEIGYISEDVVTRVSHHLDLPGSKICGLATFYNQFRFNPPGKYHLQLCNGTACYMDGSKKLLEEIFKVLDIKDGETSRDGMFSLEIVSCIGACGQAPVIIINDMHHAAVDGNKFLDIINKIKQEEGLQ